MQFKCIGTSSLGNCYLAKLGSNSFLLDAGVSIDKIISNVNLNDLEFAFISHEHKDHSLSGKKLENRGVSIIDGSIGKDWEKKQFNDYLVNVFKVEHGACDCSGIIIQTKDECILYITDFFRCKWNLHQFKFTSVIVECNYIECHISQAMIDADYKIKRQINTHMGLNGLKTFLNSLDLSKCNEIILTHQSTDTRLYNQDEAMIEIFSAYQIPVGICQIRGGIDWIGKEDFND